MDTNPTPQNNNLYGNFSPLLNTPNSAFSGFQPFKPPSNLPNYAAGGAKIGSAVGSFFNNAFKSPPQAPTQSFNQAFPIFGQLGGMKTNNYFGLSIPAPSYQNVTPPNSPITNQPTSPFGSKRNTNPTQPVTNATTPKTPVLPATSGSTANAGSITPDISDSTLNNAIQTLGGNTMVGTTNNPNGSTVGIDANGNVANGTPSQFSISIPQNIPSNILGNNITGGDVLGQQNAYSQYVQNYYNALQQYQNALLKEQADQVNGQYMGDTTDFAQGLTARQEQQDKLSEIAASNAMNAAGSVLGAVKPQEVGIGASLVSPLTGQSMYQSPYLFRPTAQSVDSLAQTLYQTGQAPDMMTAYNIAQQMVVNQATGQQVTTGVQGTQPSQTPVYQNVVEQLKAGVPFNKIYIGRGQNAQYIAQQAYNDYVSGNAQYNPQVASDAYTANAQSYAQQTKYLDTVQRAYNTALQNVGVLQNFMQANGINQSSVPIINQLTNKTKQGLLDPASVDAFNSLIVGLRQEYSQVLARGGQRSVETDNESKQVIPDNISPQQLQKVFDVLNKEGTNAIQQAGQELTNIQGQMDTAMGGGSNQTQSSTQQTQSSGNPFSQSNFFGTQ